MAYAYAYAYAQLNNLADVAYSLTVLTLAYDGNLLICDQAQGCLPCGTALCVINIRCCEYFKLLAIRLDCFYLAAADQKHLLMETWRRKLSRVQKVTAINWNRFGHCCVNQKLLGHEYAPSWVCMHHLIIVYAM